MVDFQVSFHFLNNMPRYYSLAEEDIHSLVGKDIINIPYCYHNSQQAMVLHSLKVLEEVIYKENVINLELEGLIKEEGRVKQFVSGS